MNTMNRTKVEQIFERWDKSMKGKWMMTLAIEDEATGRWEVGLISGSHVPLTVGDGLTAATQIIAAAEESVFQNLAKVGMSTSEITDEILDGIDRAHQSVRLLPEHEKTNKSMKTLRST